MKGLGIMKKVICKVEYDTDASELIQKKVFGSFGDAAGYEEDLYKTQDGKLFLYGIGGAESPYAEETSKKRREVLNPRLFYYHAIPLS